MQLRKKDQSENYERKINFDRLVKQKLAEEIVVKRAKADVINY